MEGFGGATYFFEERRGKVAEFDDEFRGYDWCYTSRRQDEES